MKVSKLINPVYIILYYRNLFLYRAFRFPVIRLIRLLHKMIVNFNLNPSGKVDCFGVELSVALKDKKGLTLYVEGSAQFDKIFYFEKLIQSQSQEPSVFIDCGANYGEFLCLASRLPGVKKWYALEPNPFVNSYLEKTIKELSESSKASKTEFHLLKSAIVPEESNERVMLHFNPFYSGGASLLEGYSQDNSKKLEVSSISIAKLLDAATLQENLKSIILKIDIEGFEFEILPTFIKEFKARNLHYSILFETHINSQESLSRLIEVAQLCPVVKFVDPKIYRGNTGISQNLEFNQYEIFLSDRE